MKYLVTGGIGFIGSHVCVELFKNYSNNLELIIIDNLSNSNISALNNLIKVIKLEVPEFNESNLTFLKMDILDESHLKQLFINHKFDAVLHFAALKSVNESNIKKDLYIKNNEEGTKLLLKIMQEFNCNNFIFSSSATVYGTNTYPVNENSNIGIDLKNVYACNKYNIEKYLSEIKEKEEYKFFSIIILRYFNPIGAHPSGLIGETPNGIPNNLFPYMLQVLDGTLQCLTVYGDDYETRDGTCIRDYIHVCDLATGHISGLLKHFNDPGIHIYNLGTGTGTTVLELINSFNKCIYPNKINYKIGNRRDGDLSIAFSINDKAQEYLGWKPIYSIDDMCTHGINFINKKLNF